MPHSSGGGSHRSGSHHHSSRSSHSSGSTRRRTRNTYFPGSRRYVYYRHRRPVYVYADYDIRRGSGAAGNIAYILLYLIVFLVLGGNILSSSRPAKKLSTNYNTQIVIEDRIGALEDSAHLERVLKAFLDKTGITPAVVTVHNEDWMERYYDLEKYAYDLYLDLFTDEKHWLIVYSHPVSEWSEDWYWEGMQGDDTDAILTDKVTSEFTRSLQTYLSRPSMETQEALEAAFGEVTDKVMKGGRVSSEDVGMLVRFALLFGILIVLQGRKAYQGMVMDKEYKQAALCPDAQSVEERTCPYCDGVYVAGTCTVCPHCAAPIQQMNTPYNTM